MLEILGLFFCFSTTVFGNGSCTSTPNDSLSGRVQMGFRYKMENFNMFDCDNTAQIDLLNSVVVLKKYKSSKSYRDFL